MPGLEASERTHNGSGLHSMNIIIANLSLVFVVLSMRLSGLASLLSRAAHLVIRQTFPPVDMKRERKGKRRLLTLTSSSTELTSGAFSIRRGGSGNKRPGTRSQGEMEKPEWKI
jgi:hypothetical protein